MYYVLCTHSYFLFLVLTRINEEKSDGYRIRKLARQLHIAKFWFDFVWFQLFWLQSGYFIWVKVKLIWLYGTKSIQLLLQTRCFDAHWNLICFEFTQLACWAKQQKNKNKKQDRFGCRLRKRWASKKARRCFFQNFVMHLK